MITNIKSLEAYCKDYTQIEHYEDALKSPLKYDLHHRLEISESKSRKQLIAENLYYYRPPEELVFLEHGEHQRLHKANLSTETRQKISDAKKGKQCALGHHCSEEARKKMSNAKKGKPGACLGRYWHLENGKHVWTD